jgi:hypothetical protein
MHQQRNHVALTRKPTAALIPALLISLMAAGSASAATLTVGAGKTYAAPCAAIGAAKDGDLIEINGTQTYTGDVCGIYANNLTIRGVNGRPKIDAGGRNAMGKGTWVVVGNNVTVENVEMFGAKVADKNGAALRLEGSKFTLRQSYLHDNENGILSGANTASDVLIEYSEFNHNGYGDGYSHNLYIGNVKSLTFRYNYSHDANVGHNLKSRAMLNVIQNNRFSSSGTGKPSYEIDLPNAGTTYVIGNVIQQPAANGNPNILAYGEEGASNPGQDLYVVNNTFLNDYGSGGTFVMVGGGVSTPALLQNNIFAGVGTMTNQSNAVNRSNYSAATPGFVDRANFDLHPTANAMVINAGTTPGASAAGVSLAPIAQYKHVASGETRVNVGQIDIGAYEAAGAVATPTPTPTPTPPTTSSWTNCASEGATCSFSGTREVRYGSGSTFVTKTFTGSATCSNAVFGDPTPNVAKTCSFASTTSSTPTPTPTPTPSPSATWTACGSEGATCSFSGTRDVRYGSGTTFVTKTFTGSAQCSNAVFGDPTPYVAKSCSVSSATK